MTGHPYISDTCFWKREIKAKQHCRIYIKKDQYKQGNEGTNNVPEKGRRLPKNAAVMANDKVKRFIRR